MSLPTVCVCVCTFKRAQLLERTLGELAKQQTEGRFAYSIVVADNDAEQSAKRVVEEFCRTSGIKTVYCVEPEQNIALARNRALENTHGDFVAFIDDDEFPAPDWLLRLLTAVKGYDVDGVLGPVRPYFEGEPPRWLVQGKFCERPEHETGLVLRWKQTRTGNVLFRRAILRDLQPAFRREFGNGGEDQDFFRRLMERDYRFVWCNEAAVYEVVPAERQRRRYMLKRALLRGQNERLLLTVFSITKSALAVPLYAASLPLMLVLGQHQFMRSSIRLMDHAGKLLAALGFRPVRGHYLNGGQSRGRRAQIKSPALPPEQ